MVDLVLEVTSAMIVLVQLDKVTFIISVEGQVSSVNSSKNFSLPTERVHTEYEVSLL